MILFESILQYITMALLAIIIIFMILVVYTCCKISSDADAHEALEELEREEAENDRYNNAK